MHSVVELEILAVTLLQESLSVDGVLAHGSGLPSKVGARWIALEQQRDEIAAVIVSRFHSADQQRHAEGADTTGLSVLLHNTGDALNQLGCRDALAVSQSVVLCHLSGLSNEQAVVGSHAAVDHSNTIRDVLDLVNGVLIVEQ